MARKLWNQIIIPAGNEAHVWELFHEASKLSPLSDGPSEEEAKERARSTWATLPYEAYPATSLDIELAPVEVGVERVIDARMSDRELEPGPITIRELATILRLSHAATHALRNGTFGGVSPLEIYFHSAHVEGLAPGVFHFNPLANNVCCVRGGDHTDLITPFVLQQDIALTATALFFITAPFERATFSNGERGYRYTLFEAGHVAQNINLVCNALNLGSVNLGGFMDRDIDSILGLDGVNHATVYMVAIGKRRSIANPPGTGWFEIGKPIGDSSIPIKR